MFFFERAFRPFFLGGSLFTVAAMLVWWWNYPLSAPGNFSGIPPVYWHAHEMIYGYALATVSGFLLTAVMNWTGENSASGVPLALTFLCWATARSAYLLAMPLPLIAVADLVFSAALFLLFTLPIIRTRQWKQVGLASKFFLLLITNGLFYAGALGWLAEGITWGITAGLFLVLAINLTMMRRVIPFFTAMALKLPEQAQIKWLDFSAIGGFLALMIAVLIAPNHWITSLIAFPLALVHGIRAWRWYHPGIWQQLLLWPLHIAYGFMVVGIGLYGFVGLNLLNEALAEHALAAGGIGLLCSAMMARVSLGHTNRSVFNPPKMLWLVFVLLAATAISRVLLPLLFPAHYIFWMHLSQWGWALAFLLLLILYLPILARPDHG